MSCAPDAAVSSLRLIGVGCQYAEEALASVPGLPRPLQMPSDGADVACEGALPEVWAVLLDSEQVVHVEDRPSTFGPNQSDRLIGCDPHPELEQNVRIVFG